MDIKDLLQLAIDRKASDLHIIVGSPPTLRKEGSLLAVVGEAPLTPDDVEGYLKKILKTEKSPCDRNHRSRWFLSHRTSCIQGV